MERRTDGSSSTTKTMGSGSIMMRPALEMVEETLGPVSILVNNAGISVVAGILDQTPEDWDKVIETNLNACFLISKLAAQSMVKQRQGKIINIDLGVLGEGAVGLLLDIEEVVQGAAGACQVSLDDERRHDFV
jgi:hypothetical protein